MLSDQSSSKPCYDKDCKEQFITDLKPFKLCNGYDCKDILITDLIPLKYCFIYCKEISVIDLIPAEQCYPKDCKEPPITSKPCYDSVCKEPLVTESVTTARSTFGHFKTGHKKSNWEKYSSFREKTKEGKRDKFSI